MLGARSRLFFRTTLIASTFLLACGPKTQTRPPNADRTAVSAEAGAGANETCSADGWCWQNPLPVGDHLRAVWLSGPDGVFAVGDGGVILAFDGARWSRLPAITDRKLTAVWGSGPRNVYAAGDKAFLHYDGSSWRSIPTEWQFTALWGFGEDTLIALTGLAQVRESHDRGGAWSSLGPDIHNLMTSVWGTAADRLILVGLNGTVVRSEGSPWTTETTPDPAGEFTGNDLSDVWATNAKNVFATSSDGVLHHDGTAWSRTPGEIMYSVWASSESDVVAVGDSIMEFDGTKWKSTAISNGTRLQSVWGSGKGDVYAVGECGVIMHRHRGIWSTDTATVLRRKGQLADIHAIAATGPSTLVAVGAPSLAYDGKAWSADPADRNFTLNDIWASPSETFAVGSNGKLFRRHGRSWSEFADSGSSIPLNAVCGAGSHVFAVGNAGVVLHFDGVKSTSKTVGSEFLNDVWAAAPDDVFAVGDNGTIFHFDGSAWSPQASGTTDSFDTVWGIGPTEVYAVAETLYRYDGTSWSRVPDLPEAMNSAASRGPTSLWGSSADNIYFVGVSGTIFHFDGNAWKQQESGTQVDLSEVVATAGGDVFVVGRCGAILRKLRIAL